MNDRDVIAGYEEVESAPSQEPMSAEIDELKSRCSAVNLELKPGVAMPGETPSFRLGMQCARDMRWLYITADNNLKKLLAIRFEKYVFLSGFEAICSYSDKTIEAAVRPLDAGFRPIIAGGGRYSEGLHFVLEPTQAGFPHLEISRASECFSTLVRPRMMPRVLTLKVSGCEISNHDHALALLRKSADSPFFQIDLLSDTALGLVRQRRRTLRRPRKESDLTSDLQYPRTEYDDAPITLYWYGRSAAGMPLLQFLAFYQVIEFYFPTYSRAEAQRKLRAILKDPTFRGDRDADIGRLLSAISASQSGAYGDERSQLRATILECIDQDSLREFLTCEPDRSEFYSGKAKTYHKLPIGNPSADLRSDVAERIYDIRCHIVHTKNDSHDREIELLLPFTREAEQLSFDIELAQYLAQQVLIAAATPFNVT